jgi:5-methylcytosine-specific restriction endonuclease McrA
MHHSRLAKFGSYDLPRRAPKPPNPPGFAHCPQCDMDYEAPRGGSRFCSDECRHERKREEWRRDNAKRSAARGVRPVERRTCEACSVVFETIYPSQRFHDAACGKRRSEKGRARKKATHKIRQYRLRLWARDPSCYLCGHEIDYSLAYPHDFSPQVDHLFPLSMGGRTTLDNLAVTHKRCNEEKGDREAALWERLTLDRIHGVTDG